MKKTALFIILYVYACFQWLHNRNQDKPVTLYGSRVFLFFDPANPKAGLHGVVAFVLPTNASVEEFCADLWGPFGYTSQISLLGLHLYGRDTWGTVSQDQITANPALRDLARNYPNRTILLAGVRKIFGRHPWPLNHPEKFILVWK